MRLSDFEAMVVGMAGEVPREFLDGVAEIVVSPRADDVVLDRIVRAVPDSVPVRWAGREYRVAVPRGATLPAFLLLEGMAEPPPGELTLVLRRKPGVLALLRPGRRYHAVVRVAEPHDYLPGTAPDGGGG